MTLVYFDSFFFIFFGSFIVCSLVFTVSFFCLGGTIEDIALLLSLLCRIALRLRIYFFFLYCNSYQMSGLLFSGFAAHD